MPWRGYEAMNLGLGLGIRPPPLKLLPNEAASSVCLEVPDLRRVATREPCVAPAVGPSGACSPQGRLPCRPPTPRLHWRSEFVRDLARARPPGRVPMPDPSTGNPRVLILHAATGAGHRRAAQALESAFQTLAPGGYIRALDTLQFASKLFQRGYTPTYNTLVGRVPRFWGLLYKGLEHPRIHRGTAPARL